VTRSVLLLLGHWGKMEEGRLVDVWMQRRDPPEGDGVVVQGGESP